ncbi:hypothetical protein [Nostoc sp.]
MVVIGAGTAGLVVAAGLDLGLKVALIEKHLSGLLAKVLISSLLNCP